MGMNVRSGASIGYSTGISYSGASSAMRPAPPAPGFRQRSVSSSGEARRLASLAGLKQPEPDAEAVPTAVSDLGTVYRIEGIPRDLPLLNAHDDVFKGGRLLLQVSPVAQLPIERLVVDGQKLARTVLQDSSSGDVNIQHVVICTRDPSLESEPEAARAEVLEISKPARKSLLQDFFRSIGEDIGLVDKIPAFGRQLKTGLYVVYEAIDPDLGKKINENARNWLASGKAPYYSGMNFLASAVRGTNYTANAMRNAEAAAASGTEPPSHLMQRGTFCSDGAQHIVQAAQIQLYGETRGAGRMNARAATPARIDYALRNDTENFRAVGVVRYIDEKKDI